MPGWANALNAPRRAAAVALAAVVAATAASVPSGAASESDPRRARRAARSEQARGLRLLPTRRSLYNVSSPTLRSLRTPVRRAAADAGPPSTENRSFDTVPSPSANFDGVVGTGRGAPPDPTGEAGPGQGDGGYYVQSTNDGFGIFTKSGTRVVDEPEIGFLWRGAGLTDRCATSGRGDPIVQYDQLADRWMLSQFAFDLTPSRAPVGPFFECIAVSQTSDPLGDYWLYSFFVSQATFPDFPKFGVWPDGYYMTVHLFDIGTGSFQGLGAIAFERNKMLEGRPANQIVFTSTAPDFFGALPADITGTRPPPLGSPNVLLAMDDGPTTDEIQIFGIVLDWMDIQSSTATGPVVVQPQPFDSNLCNRDRQCIPQPDTTNRLDSLAAGPLASSMVMYRLGYRNFETHESLVLNHTVDVDGTDRAGIRWYEIRDPTANPTIHQQGTYSPDATHRWMGSIASDQVGNIALGFSASSETVFPSVRYTGRLAGDPLGQMPQGEATLVAGGGSQTGNPRWGDYTHMSLDPVDDCTFWYTNEYYASTSSTSWRTRIGSFEFPGCDAQAPPPVENVAPALTDVADRPDPFTPQGARKKKTKIFFTLAEPAVLQVGIFKRNRLVVQIADAVLEAGSYFASWNGKDAARRLVKAGTFTYRIDATDEFGNLSSANGTVRVKR